MEPGYDPLRAQYRMLTTAALIEIEREGGLTPAAEAALREELAQRDDRPIHVPTTAPAPPATEPPAPARTADGKLAPRGARLLARMIDFVIPYVIFYGPLWLLSPFVSESEEMTGLDALWMVVIVALLIASVGYTLLADALPGGQSLGKRLVAIRVVDEKSGAACTRWQSFIRNLVLGAANIVDVLFIFGQRRQRLGDLAARTIVVNKPSPFWAD